MDRETAFAQLEAFVLFNDKVRLQHRFGKFLNKQRHTVCFGDDLVEHLGGERLADGDLFDHGGDLLPAQAGERQRCYV